jgi:hypothetical protein
MFHVFQVVFMIVARMSDTEGVNQENNTSLVVILAAFTLGWEFQFSVLISGTPIGSGIPILFLLTKILVGNIFLNSAVEKLPNQNSDSKIQNSKINLP